MTKKFVLQEANNKIIQGCNNYYGCISIVNYENVSDLMFFVINGPLVEDFNSWPYVKAWLRDHKSAVSAPRGKGRKKQIKKMTIHENNILKSSINNHLIVLLKTVV